MLSKHKYGTWLFEPYFIVVLPHFLTSRSPCNVYVLPQSNLEPEDVPFHQRKNIRLLQFTNHQFLSSMSVLGGCRCLFSIGIFIKEPGKTWQNKRGFTSITGNPSGSWSLWTLWESKLFVTQIWNLMGFLYFSS